MATLSGAMVSYRGGFILGTEVARFLDSLLLNPHEVEMWFHSWYKGRVETLDSKYILNSSLLTVSVAT